MAGGTKDLCPGLSLPEGLVETRDKEKTARQPQVTEPCAQPATQRETKRLGAYLRPHCWEERDPLGAEDTAARGALGAEDTAARGASHSAAVCLNSPPWRTTAIVPSS